MKRAFLTLAACTLLLLCAMPAHASDDFDATVQSMTRMVGRKPLHIPFLGAMLFFTPARSSHIKLATFEDIEGSYSLAELEQSMHGVLGPEWHPFVRVDSRSEHESTIIYAKAVNGQMRLMIVTAESRELTVVQVDVPKNLQGSWFDEPGRKAHHPTDDGGDTGA